MFSQSAIERAVGILVPLVVVMLAASFSLGSGKVGIDTRSEYFYGTGTESWEIVANEHLEQLDDGLGFQAGAGALAMATAGLFYLMFRSRSSSLSNASTWGLLAAGGLILIGAGASFRVSDLAGQWLVTSGADAERIADSAFTAITLRFVVLIIGFPLFLGSLLAFGVATQRLSGLPRWLNAFPMLGGGLLVISPIGFVTVGIFLFIMASGAVLLSWLIIISARLILRGAVAQGDSGGLGSQCAKRGVSSLRLAKAASLWLEKDYLLEQRLLMINLAGV